MSSERAGAPAHGALNREKAREVLQRPETHLRGEHSDYWENAALNALEACVVPDPRITRIEALLDDTEAQWDHLVLVDDIRDILRGDQ